MNGLGILRTYSMTEVFETVHGGFAQLGTLTVTNIAKVDKEDKEILKDIGWTQEGPHYWRLEWWD